ncbi:peroxisomal membrane protein 11C-like [Glandiceps talaboti]
MELAVSILESYRGKDKVMRVVSFSSLLAAGLVQNKNKVLSERLQLLTSNIGGARTVTRLFDDLAMAAHTLVYGFGKHERDPVIRWLSVIKNIFDQAFYPIEHIAWLGDKKIIQIQSTAKWMIASVVVWAVSLTISIIITLRKLLKLQREKKRLGEELTNARLREDSLEAIQALEGKFKAIKAQEFMSKLDIVKNGTDLGNAIHWCPPGFLWAGKLNMTTVGLLGTIASFVGLYNIVLAHKTKLKRN